MGPSRDQVEAQSLPVQARLACVLALLMALAALAVLAGLSGAAWGFFVIALPLAALVVMPANVLPVGARVLGWLYLGCSIVFSVVGLILLLPAALMLVLGVARGQRPARLPMAAACLIFVATLSLLLTWASYLFLRAPDTLAAGYNERPPFAFTIELPSGELARPTLTSDTLYFTFTNDEDKNFLINRLEAQPFVESVEVCSRWRASCG